LAAADLAGQGYGEKENQTPLFAFSAFSAPQGWPDSLAEDACYGLAGEIVHTIGPETEADPVALLIQFLTAFGTSIGRSAHHTVESTDHFTNLSIVLVGATAKARKGTSWDHIGRLFKSVDEQWTENRIQSGLSSGEGLIWAVRDPLKDDEGVTDKRLLVVESEFASTLKVLKREGNTLSPVIRNAWDTGNLNILTKNSPAKATGAHISIIGHITKEELLRYLDNTEAGNGFGNRFLWACVKRSKLLPFGGAVRGEDFQILTQSLQEAVEFAKTVEQIGFDKEAAELWVQVYPELSEGKPGLLGAMIARAEAQAIRLACIYALLDLSSTICTAHLRTALAVWRYCEDSCRYIFGDSLGDPLADDLLRALGDKKPEGLTRTDVNRLFKGHKASGQIGRALNLLENQGLVRQEFRKTGGRPTEVWFAVEKCEKSEISETSHEVEKEDVVLT